MAEIELGKMEHEVDEFLLKERISNKDVDDFLANWLVKLFTRIYCEK